jgi:hypothetical protein
VTDPRLDVLHVRVLPLVDEFPHDLVVTLDNGAPPYC